VALRRIESMLTKYVPNPIIYPVSAKQALQAKLAGDEQALNVSGFPEFERGLLKFLSKGRGGLLLKSKIQKGLDHLQNIQTSLNQRIGALDSEKGLVEEELENAKKTLITETDKKKKLEKDIQSREIEIIQSLKDLIREREDYFNFSLKTALQEEPDVSVLKNNILNFQRDTIETLQNGIEDLTNKLLKEYDASSRTIIGNLKDILGNLSREASNSLQSIRVEREKVKINTSSERVKSGAVIGGALGAGAGISVASGITTTTITAAGTIATTAAFSTLGLIGIGILTGGLGLLIGAGVASLLESQKNSTAGSTQYVQYEEFVNNRRALLAVERFLDKLKSNTNRIAGLIINSTIEEVIKPVEWQIKHQEDLIDQIKKDLNQTIAAQKSTRNTLLEKRKKVEELNNNYVQLLSLIESL